MAYPYSQPPMQPLTPPDSSKEEKADSFAAVAQSDALFPPLNHVSSPNVAVARNELRTMNAPLPRKRYSTSPQPTLFGLGAPFQEDDKENQAEECQVYEPSPKRQKRTTRTENSYARPANQSSIEAMYKEALPVLQANRRPEDRGVSPPCLADASIFIGFLQEVNPKACTWLQPTSDRYPTVPTKYSHPPDASAPRPAPAGNKSRAVASPSKSARSHKGRSQTPNVQVKAPPNAQVKARHGRNRSNISDSHHGENKQSRGPPQKPQVSKNCEDWPDFTAHNEPLRAILDHAGLETALQFGALSSSKVRATSTDPLFETLHPAERDVCMRVGLDANRFLYAKRSVFCGYLKHLLYINNKRSLEPAEVSQCLKSWNKTAAQGCASIDVNKVSKLYECWWKKLGWFEPEFFTKYIENYSPSNVRFPVFDEHGNLEQAGGYFGPE